MTRRKIHITNNEKLNTKRTDRRPLFKYTGQSQLILGGGGWFSKTYDLI